MNRRLRAVSWLVAAAAAALAGFVALSSRLVATEPRKPTRAEQVAKARAGERGPTRVAPPRARHDGPARRPAPPRTGRGRA